MSDDPQKYRLLRRLKLSRVDMVPAGANPGAHIRLVKSESARSLEDRLRAELASYAGKDEYLYVCDFTDTWVVYQVADGPYIQRSYTDAGTAIAFGDPVEVYRDTRYVAKKGLSGGAPTVWAKVSGRDKENSMTPEELAAEVEKLKAEKAETDAELAKAREELDNTVESEVAKAQAEVETLKAELAKAQDADVRKELDQAKADLAEVRKAQRKTEFVTLAKEYADLGNPAEIADLLMAADDHFADEPKALLEKFLKSAAEQVKTGALFARMSKDDGDSPRTWEETLTEKARDRVAKGTSPTIEQAKVAIMGEDPEIRKAYEQSVRS